MGEYDLTLGPYSVGTNINFFLCGLVAYQYVHYWDITARDTRLIRGLVSWMLAVDLTHTALCGYLLWLYTITHFAEPEFSREFEWVYCIQPMFVAFSSVPVQLFLAFRVYGLSRNKYLLGFTVATSIIQGLASIGTSIGCLILADITKLQNLTPIVLLWNPVQIVCDLTITSSLVWTLHKSRTGYKATDNVVKRIIRSSVETAFFALLLVVLDLIFFFAMPATNLHILFAFITGRAYSNALLATLNTRQSHRELLAGPAGTRLDTMAFGRPTTTLGETTIGHKDTFLNPAISISVSQVVDDGRSENLVNRSTDKVHRIGYSSV